MMIYLMRQKKFRFLKSKMRFYDCIFFFFFSHTHNVKDYALSSQEYIKTLDELPKPSLLELFQKRYLCSFTVIMHLLNLSFSL